MQSLLRLMDIPLFQRNSAEAWLVAVGTTALVYAMLLLTRRYIRNRHAAMLRTDATEFMEIPFEALARTHGLFLASISVYVGIDTLEMAPHTHVVLVSILTVLAFWQAGLWAVAALSGWLERRQRTHLAADRAVFASLSVISFLAKFIIWTVVLLLVLENLGVNITALVAGMGIGGIAVALAVQNILGDLFASLSITFDKPFLVGEFLIIDDFMGTVEHIGIKSTRLRSLSGEQIVLSNADLLKSRLRNYGRMNERRVVFSIGVTYETSPDQLEQIPLLVRRIVEAQPGTRFDRCHFARFGSADLQFETVYYVLSADYNQFMDVQQTINIRLMRELSTMKVDFAYPTQRLLLERANANSETRGDGAPLRERHRSIASGARHNRDAQN